MAARTIGFGNQKGGVGKTSCLIEVAAALGALGHRVLVVDLDPTGGATRALGMPPSLEGTYEALLGQSDPMDLVLRGSHFPEGVELLPSRRVLEQFEPHFMATRPRESAESARKKALLALNGLLPSLEEEFDYILLDTAPHAGTLTVSAYLAAEFFVLATVPLSLSQDALRDALFDVVTIRQESNPRLRLLGIVICMVDRRIKAHQDYVGRLRTWPETFRTIIHRTQALPDAQERGQTLLQYRPKNPVADEFRALTQELLERVHQEEPS